MKLRDQAARPDLPLPAYARDGDAGLDLLAAEDLHARSRGSALPSRRASRSRSPRATRASCTRARARALREGLALVNAPG